MAAVASVEVASAAVEPPVAGNVTMLMAGSIRRIVCAVVSLWFAVIPVLAQHDYQFDFEDKEVKEPTEEEQIARGDKLKVYTLNPNTGDLLRSHIDTAMLGFYNRVKAEGRSLAIGYLGNLNSPWESKMFFDRPLYHPQFMYMYGLHGMLIDPFTARFYDTKSPTTQVLYLRHGDNQTREEELRSTLALNIGKRINIGNDVDYIYSNGFYNSNKTKAISYRFFGSYRSDRYEAYAYVGNNYYLMTENGGITNDDYVIHPGNFANGTNEFVSTDIPVKFPGNNMFNSLRQGTARLTHRYNLGFYREGQIEYYDGNEFEAPHLIDTMVFVPVGSISHTFNYTKSRRRFKVKNPLDDSIYPNLFIKRLNDAGEVITLPNDTTRMEEYHNTLALSLREGFHRWAKFGLTAYVRLENRFYTLQDSVVGVPPTDREFSTYIGGEISRRGGKYLNFAADGELSVVGSDAGAFKLRGRLSTAFDLLRRKTEMEAWGQLLNTRPGYFLRHHHGTVHWWDESFDFIQQLRLGGSLRLKDWGTTLTLQSATLKNYIYFDHTAFPQQVSSPIQVLEGRIAHAYRWGALGWEVEAAYQTSSNRTALPLPKLAAYGNLYLDFRLPSSTKVMRIQTGVDARIHSSYYAPYYEPAVQQFTTQQEIKVGGSFPLMNAYVNIHLKRSRFFFEMYNLAEAFMDSKRFSLVHTPYNPRGLRMGIAIDFNK